MKHRSSPHASGPIDAPPVKAIVLIFGVELSPSIHASTILSILMRLLMRSEIGTLGESLIASRIGADVRLLTCMGPQMCAQIKV
jgi:hypothetical protein